MKFSSDLEQQLHGYGLTTAHILYRIPDFESVLQTYVWQHYDVAKISQFLAAEARWPTPFHTLFAQTADRPERMAPDRWGVRSVLTKCVVADI